MKLEYILISIVAVALGVALALGLRTHGGATNALKDAAEQVSPSQTLTLEEKSKRYEKYHEIEKPGGFVNTSGQPITIAQYIGKKVILLDVMTYSCINCQRTFPYTNKWFREYEDQGLIIIGIHTPEFAFEHDINNVTEAMQKFGIKFPIVLDNEYGTWNAYGNSYWPRKYLIDIDGYVVYDHIGEGEYDKTEAKIVDLLNERAQRLGEKEKITIGNISDPTSLENTASLFGGQSPESYLGNARSEYDVSSKDLCLADPCKYTIPATIPQNHFALSGIWAKQPEYMQLVSPTGVITYHFRAKKVHLVAQALGGNIKAEVYLDGKPLSATDAGPDVINGMVTFHDARLYTLINLSQRSEEHTIEIRVQNPGLQVYAFTFG